ncbi:MAG: signal recognition particle receptor subunit alpha, partial [Gammaproteobacteria bacterium]|nr:signal recognition particle receptor subunit alpha [Gammaproteobacteria bacterium]
MFDGLSDRLASTAQKLRGEGRLTENNIQDALRDVRMALLEADVALAVVRSFIDEVKQRALGEEVLTSLKPGHAFINIVQEELVKVMGVQNESLDLSAQPPAVVLMAGLQGAGKTTTVAKLAKMLNEREKKKSLLVSCDIYRPAAIEQLKTLAAQVGAEFFPSNTEQKPTDIA